MKKLMVLLMVLAFVSVANAGVVDLMITGLNGSAIDPTKEITIAPSDTLSLDIYYTSDVWYLASMAFDVVATGPGSLDMANSTISATFDPGYSAVKLPTGVDAVSFATEGAVDGELVVGNILFHCDGLGLVTIDLIENAMYDAGATTEVLAGYADMGVPTLSGVIIHQIPEPMTLALLGLGGLLLRRRK